MSFKRTITILSGILFLLAADAGYANLVLEIDAGNDFETFIVNPSTTPVNVDGYTISSSTGILDPADWNSIEDQRTTDFVGVATQLGAGALSFGEITASSSNLTEGSISDVAIWQPGGRFSIGHPFGRIAGDFIGLAEFSYLDLSAGGTVIGSITAVPETGQAGILMLLILLAAGRFWQRLGHLR